VGGCVRDAILGVEPKDFDLATKLHPEEVECRLEAAGIHFVVTGIRRGTITAIIDGEPFEITTFRNPADETQFVDNIETDLAARDFTINAIAIRVIDGKMVDPFGGVKDLEANLLQCVGSAKKRFEEDPHRILRMIRFGFGAGREVGLDVFVWAKCLAHLLKSVAAERIHDEFIKILCSQHPSLCLRRMHDLGILELILPELEACVAVEQNHHHKLDVFEHTLATVRFCPADKHIRLAALFHDIAKPICKKLGDDKIFHFLMHDQVGEVMAKQIMERMKFSVEDIDIVCMMVAKHDFPTNCGPAAVRRLIRACGEKMVRDLIVLKKADRQTHVDVRIAETMGFERMFEAELEKAKIQPFAKLAVDGLDVMRIRNIKPGKEVGQILKKLEEMVMENPAVNNRENLIQLLETI
jgi:tRNA nucleotidyltransferase (CCA-adding enzyme)